MFAAGVTNNFAITILAFALLFGPVVGAIGVAPGAAVGGVAQDSPRPMPASNPTTASRRSTAPRSMATTTSRIGSRPSTVSRSPSNSTVRRR